MGNLATLRRKVLVRLGDLDRKRQFEADEYLNEAQDTFLRETQYLRLMDQIDIEDGTASYALTVPSGRVVVEVKSVTFISGLINRPLALTTVEEMDRTETFWMTMTGDPEWYIRNLNLATDNTQASNAFRLAPIPTADVTNGLRVIYTATTSGALTTDASETLFPEFDDAMVSYALAQMGHPNAETHMANFNNWLVKARALAARGYENQTIRVKSWR